MIMFCVDLEPSFLVISDVEFVCTSVCAPLFVSQHVFDIVLLRLSVSRGLRRYRYSGEKRGTEVRLPTGCHR